MGSLGSLVSSLFPVEMSLISQVFDEFYLVSVFEKDLFDLGLLFEENTFNSFCQNVGKNLSLD